MALVHESTIGRSSPIPIPISLRDCDRSCRSQVQHPVQHVAAKTHLDLLSVGISSVQANSKQVLVSKEGVLCPTLLVVSSLLLPLTTTNCKRRPKPATVR